MKVYYFKITLELNDNLLAKNIFDGSPWECKRFSARRLLKQFS